MCFTGHHYLGMDRLNLDPDRHTSHTRDSLYHPTRYTGPSHDGFPATCLCPLHQPAVYCSYLLALHDLPSQRDPTSCQSPSPPNSYKSRATLASSSSSFISLQLESVFAPTCESQSPQATNHSSNPTIITTSYLQSPTMVNPACGTLEPESFDYENFFACRFQDPSFAPNGK